MLLSSQDQKTEGEERMPWNCEPLPIFRDGCPSSFPHTLFSPSRLAHPEGTTLAPRPCPRGIEQLHVHLASVEKARLHHSQDCQLHCALQPLGAQERLPGHLLHQVGKPAHAATGQRGERGEAADGDKGRDPGIQETFLAHILQRDTLRVCWGQVEKGSPFYPIPSQQSLALNFRECAAGQTYFSNLRGLLTG